MSKNCRTSDSALLMILGRLGLPDRLPFSKPKVNWLLHQPEITFLATRARTILKKL